jgi:glycosyltransferase involved in cell wall biosynthesis
LRIGYFTNIAPHYRNRLWLDLVSSQAWEIHFYYGRSASIKEILFNSEWESYKSNLNLLQNIYWKNRLIFQNKAIGNAIRKNFDTILLLGDMNVLSSWVIAIIAKLSGTRLVFWGHGFYGNESWVVERIRLMFYSLADAHLVYNNRGKKLMIQHGIKDKDIHVVYNSLDYYTQKDLRKKVLSVNLIKKEKLFETLMLPTLVFIGRLTPVKRIDVLIRAFINLNKKSIPLNLLIIGDGQEKEKLIELSKPIESHVHFYGKCYDEEKIGSLIANCDLCVSPGNVGLTAIHSLSYGTPVCTHDSFENQMPEFEVIVEGQTGTFYSEKSNNLEEVIEAWLSSDLDREQIRKNCYETIDKFYNPNYQLSVFTNLFVSDFLPDREKNVLKNS